MKTYSFTIYGNQEDPSGNPVPKLKMTGRQHWTDKAHAYAKWKKYVRDCFLKKWLEAENNIPIIPLADPKCLRKDCGGKIDLKSDQVARMDLEIWWANEKHGDPENIFGSIADAIFENDKHLDGSFVAKHHPEGKGRVEVKIKLES